MFSKCNNNFIRACMVSDMSLRFSLLIRIYVADTYIYILLSKLITNYFPQCIFCIFQRLSYFGLLLNQGQEIYRLNIQLMIQLSVNHYNIYIYYAGYIIVDSVYAGKRNCTII